MFSFLTFSFAVTFLLLTLSFTVNNVNAYLLTHSSHILSNYKSSYSINDKKVLYNNKKDYYDLVNRNELSLPTTTATTNYKMDKLNEGLAGSPGFMSEAPVNTQTLARKEMAQIVVSAAVLYLSLNIRFTEFLDKLDYKNQDEIDIPLIMPNGIQYTDFAPIVPGQNTNSNSNITPNRGDEMILLAKLYYNGLQINKNKNELISFLCVSEGNYKEVYSLENSDYKDVPLSGLKEAIKGMKYNNRRKVIIPSYLAFGSEGLPPFIPPGSAVMYELTLTKKL